MNLNKVFLIGRVTKEVEVLSTTSGKKVARISLATNMFMGKGKEDKTTFHNLVAWSSIADVAEKYVTKGQEIMIEGHIDNRTYENKQGIKKNISEVIIERLQLGSKPKNETQGKQETKEEDSLPMIDVNEESVDDFESIDESQIPF